jgi:hypothetical protein
LKKIAAWKKYHIFALSFQRSLHVTDGGFAVFIRLIFNAIHKSSNGF